MSDVCEHGVNFYKSRCYQCRPLAEVVPVQDYPLSIVVRPLLMSGCWGYEPGKIYIYIDEELTREEATITLWHELVHALMECRGQTRLTKTEIQLGNLESYVEEIARRLAVACPEILELTGVDSRFLNSKATNSTARIKPRIELKEEWDQAEAKLRAAGKALSAAEIALRKTRDAADEARLAYLEAASDSAVEKQMG